jgi:hypothetical protein
MNKWYLIATPDNRKKYKLRMLTHSIFSKKVDYHIYADVRDKGQIFLGMSS